jgi:hypothetical protein
MLKNWRVRDMTFFEYMQQQIKGYGEVQGERD